jgi:hypothetical protein
MKTDTTEIALRELTSLIAYYDDGRRWMRGGDGWDAEGRRCFMVAAERELHYNAALDYLVKVSQIVLGTPVIADLNDSCPNWHTAKFCLEAARLLAIDDIAGQAKPRAAGIRAGYLRAMQGPNP